MKRAIAVCLLASALAANPAPHKRRMNDCGNSNFCPYDMTCAATPDDIVVPARDRHFIKVDHHHHRQTNIVIGNKFGCSPAKKATMCQDKRYSCPSGFSCAVDGKTQKAKHCQHDGASAKVSKPRMVPLLHNVDSKRIPHHMAKHAPLSFPHLAKARTLSATNLVKLPISSKLLVSSATPSWAKGSSCGCICSGCTQTAEGWCDCGGCDCSQGGCQQCTCCTLDPSDDDAPMYDDDDWGGYDDDYSGGGGSFCASIRSSLPSECACTDVSGGSNVNCELSFSGTSVGVALKITPCQLPACMGLDVILLGYQYPVTGMCMGETGRIAVPGAAIDIYIGAAGIFATYSISGSASRLTMSMGIDACVTSFLTGELCVYGGAGYEVIEASVGLSTICESSHKISNTTTTTRPQLRAPTTATAVA